MACRVVLVAYDDPRGRDAVCGRLSARGELASAGADRFVERSAEPGALLAALRSVLP